MRANWMVVTVLAVMGATGCGAAGESGGQDLDATGAPLAGLPDGYVTLRPDASCGGYFVKDAGGGGVEIPVSGLDFGGSGLDRATVAAALSAPAEELVLRGHLGSIERPSGTRSFVVREVYRGMPGVRAGDGDALYMTEPAGGDAPWALGMAMRIGSTSGRSFDAIDVSRAALPWVDRVWLADRATHGRAVVAASLIGHGRETLVADQVFVRLPDRAAPCADSAPPSCAGASIPGYRRTVDRCLAPAACVAPKLCTMFLPVCADGYTLRSWPGSGGCTSYACDPSFLGEED